MHLFIIHLSSPKLGAFIKRREIHILLVFQKNIIFDSRMRKRRTRENFIFNLKRIIHYNNIKRRKFLNILNSNYFIIIMHK